VISTFKKSWLTIGIGVLALLALLLFFKVNPEGNTFFPKCPLHQHTGIYCSGCGSQRAIHDLLNGQLMEAASHNALLPLALLALFQHYSLKGMRLLRHPNTEKVRLWAENQKSWLTHRYAPLVILVLALGFMILRNLPFESLEFLRP